jgi:hypothetical protein
MRRPILGLLLASTGLLAASLPARAARAEPPLAPYAVAAPGPASAWAAPLAGTRRRSSGAMVGGIVLTTLGAIAMAAGTGGYVDAVAGCTAIDVNGTQARFNCDNGGAKLAGMATLLVGAAGVAAGVPLWIFGSEQVAATAADHAPKPSAAVLIGPATAGLRVSF